MFPDRRKGGERAWFPLFCMLLVVLEFHQLCGALIYVCTLVMLHGSTLHMCHSSEYSVYYNRSCLEWLGTPT